MSKAKYTLEEVHLYYRDLIEEEDRLSRLLRADKQHKILEDSVHVMREVHQRMQESIRDHGIRKSKPKLSDWLRKIYI
jgi:hypothetical protein